MSLFYSSSSSSSSCCCCCCCCCCWCCCCCHSATPSEPTPAVKAIIILFMLMLTECHRMLGQHLAVAVVIIVIIIIAVLSASSPPNPNMYNSSTRSFLPCFLHSIGKFSTSSLGSFIHSLRPIGSISQSVNPAGREAGRQLITRFFSPISHRFIPKAAASFS